MNKRIFVEGYWEFIHIYWIKNCNEYNNNNKNNNNNNNDYNNDNN